MDKPLSNDEKIFQLKAEIEAKKKKLKGISKFEPITNCSLELGEKRYNLHVLKGDQLLVLASTLYGLQANIDVIFPGEKLVLSGSPVADWITDLKAKFEIENRRAEESRLKALEARLHEYHSTDVKVSLDLDNLGSLI